MTQSPTWIPTEWLAPRNKLQKPGYKSGKQSEIKLSLWCLDSSVIFSPMVSSLRSVVLTSGTLSPMDVMASELNVKFVHRLEALHIIDDTGSISSLMQF